MLQNFTWDVYQCCRSDRYVKLNRVNQYVDCAPSVFFLVRIFKLNLESRGMFAELSYLTIILTNINTIMLRVTRMLESKTSVSDTI